MKITLHRQIDDVAAAEWNQLVGTDNPFLRHEFLAALEHCRCVGGESGWQPHHLVVRDDHGAVVSAQPLYRKMNSFGEFVFDWAWADAYMRSGLAYYPKVVAAVPFSPVPGHRVLLAPTANVEDARREAAGALREYARDSGASSAHCLFPRPEELSALSALGFAVRKDCQFHWHNREYPDFESFLARFSAPKRKKVRRERRRVREAGIRFEWLHGSELTPTLIDTIYGFYTTTFAQRGRAPYLTRAFFHEIATTMGGSLVVILALHTHEPVAAAICFEGAGILHGRHWGAAADYHSLHFETCYYQGIEYCIDARLAAFQPGTQGEHKLARGFEPSVTWSAHWIANPDFRAAIARYLEQERTLIDRYVTEAGTHLPFRKSPE